MKAIKEFVVIWVEDFGISLLGPFGNLKESQNCIKNNLSDEGIFSMDDYYQDGRINIEVFVKKYDSYDTQYYFESVDFLKSLPKNWYKK